MKKKKIIIGLFAVVFAFISLFGSYINVKADDNKTLTISLTSNAMQVYRFYSLRSVRDIYIAQFLTGMYQKPESDDTYLNQDGKEVFRVVFDYHDDNQYINFELLEEATNDDLLYTIDDDMRAYSIDYLGLDLFEGYDSVQFMIEECEEPEFGEIAFINLANVNSVFDMNFFDYFILMEASDEMNEFVDVIDRREYQDKDGKVLATRADSPNGYVYTITEGLTVEDNIVQELSEEDYSYISNRFGLNLSEYNRLIITFVDDDQEFEETDYVFNASVLDSQNYYRFDDFYRFLSIKSKAILYDITDFCEKDTGTLLFSLIEDDALDLYNVVANPELGYEDNMVFDVEEGSEFYDEVEEEMGINVSKFVIIFANPEFIDGEDQEYDSESGESLSFRLNIPFDKFLDGGVVYLDDEEVDPESYEATEGSTIITFKDDFVAGLDEGDHEVKVVVMDGYATANFKIVSDTAEEESAEDSPATGDHIYVFFALIGLSIAGIVGGTVYLQKKSKLKQKSE